MKQESNFANNIASGEFIITAEFLPQANADGSFVESVSSHLSNGLSAVNVADNPYGPVMSSLAGSVLLSRSGIEPVYQIVTRDRNRIALQSDLMGAASLGIRNVLCLSGYHQALTGCPESANVYDIDSIQLIAAIQKMNNDGILFDGKKINNKFSMFAGAVANPYMAPLELNIMRLEKKVEAGANFIQTQAVFDIDLFQKWIDAARKENITEKTAILAGIIPLESAEEAENLRKEHTDFHIPDKVIERLRTAGDQAAKKKEGLAISAEIIKNIKKMEGVRGIHIISGGKEAIVPEVIDSL